MVSTLRDMDPLIERNREHLRELAARRGLKRIRVFGSMARGDARPGSDVDLLVEVPPGVSGLAIGGLVMDAQELLGRHVDVVTTAALGPALREAVLADAVLL
jgi:predicted nucleotidyltransferase